MSRYRLLVPRALVSLAVVTALAATTVLPAGAATRYWGYQDVIDITFPVKGPTSYGDWYWAGRGDHVHQATDIMASKMQKVFAARSGTVRYMTGVGEKPPSWGMMITVCGDDGRSYSYIHLNNDRPGTDNNSSRLKWAYSPKVRPGVHVKRGQWLGYVGDSGNAESTAPHLHFEIEDPDLRDKRIRKSGLDPYRLNPYRSLRKAERQGDYPGAIYPKG